MTTAPASAPLPPPRVVIMTKDPVPGRVKTRLIPALGAQRAAALHRALVRYTLDQAMTSGLPVVVALAGDLQGPFADGLRSRGALVIPQLEGDLGDRLRAVLTVPGRQVCIGTDCPGLLASDLRQAAASTQTCLGPATDGGYWLIAVGGAGGGADSEPPHPALALLRDIPWSSPRTLEVTLERAASAQISVRLLATRDDLDRPADLLRLAADPEAPPALRPFLLASTEP